MPTKLFTSGRIRRAEYDPATRQLDLHWDNQAVLAYKHVPEEVFQRLCSAPNPATYWEDRIAEEYPKGTPRPSGASRERPRDLRDLFGSED
jgi:hypothetical protein